MSNRICNIDLLNQFNEFLEEISEDGTIELNHELLRGILLFLDNYSDIEDESYGGEPRPNEAMRLSIQFENLPYVE